MSHTVPPPTLFYSRFCKHCVGLLDEYRHHVENSGVRTSCVDNMLDEVPSIISEVPALIVPSKKRVYFSNGIRTALNEIISQGSVTENVVNPIEAQCNSGESFSFLDGPDTNPIATEKNRIDDNFANPFETPTIFGSLSEPEDTKSSDKLTDTSISVLQAKRDADISALVNANQRPVI